MTVSVAVLSFVAALLLAAAGGAPLAGSATSDESSSPNTVALVSEIVATATNNFRDERWKSLLARVSRGVSEPVKVTIGEAAATNLKGRMEQLNEELVVDVKRDTPKCGVVAINKVSSDSGDIPSYFYEVKCPERCSADGAGNRVFRSVGLKTLYFRKLDGDAKDQYEVDFRRQVVGCCLEENERNPDLAGHAEKPSSVSARR